MKVFQSKLILSVIVLSLLWWGYLTFASSMSLGGDALGYERLGQRVAGQGWAEYLRTGPNREPVYVGVVALSVQWANILSLPYQKILTFLQVGMLFAAQLILGDLLIMVGVGRVLTAACMLYFAFSPAMINSAFSLYSEIAMVPLVLWACWLLLRLVDAWRDEAQKYVSTALWLGFVFALLVLVKGAFEVIVPLTMILIGLGAFRLGYLSASKAKPILTSLLLCLLVFSAVVGGYKALNKCYNGHFVVTDRASWALYGNTLRRMEPLNLQMVQSAVLYVPGEGVCRRWLGRQGCFQWSFSHSDDIGMSKYNQLIRQHIPEDQVDHQMIKGAFGAVISNPLQYGFFYLLEGMKMFFWESTHIGFVNYPAWLEKLYDQPFCQYGLRAVLFMVSFAAFIFCFIQGWCIPKPKATAMVMTVLAGSYIGVYAFFYILTRYALGVAPLFLIMVAWAVAQYAVKLQERR